ncbi:MAG: glycosyltransferase [Cetobacterium sp.]
MKKRVLFMVINMNVGGVEKALLNQLKTMSPEEYSVTILMLEKFGSFLEEIPEWVEVDYLKNYPRVKYLFNNPPKEIVMNFFKDGLFLKGIYYFLIFLGTKLLGSREILLKNIFSKYPSYKKEFDEAIAYAGPMSLIDYYILKKVKAEQKIGWIHFDVTTIGLDKKLINRIYKGFDEIKIVSKDAKQKFDEVFPLLKDKTSVAYNVILEGEILKLASHKGFSDSYKGLRLLTVGRVSKEKGQDLSIEVLKRLIDSGVDAKLYFIGDGVFRSYCEKLARDLKIEEKVIFLGTKTNPYPYMKECDIYIQPSKYEGYCITLAEVLIFNKPIVATKFTGALEQLAENKNSRIVDYSSEAIFKGVNELLKRRKK